MVVGLVTVEPAAPQHELSPPFTGIGTWNGLQRLGRRRTCRAASSSPTQDATVRALPPTRRSHSVLLRSAEAAGTHTLRLAGEQPGVALKSRRIGFADPSAVEPNEGARGGNRVS